MKTNNFKEDSDYQNLIQLNRKLKDKVFSYVFSNQSNLAEFCNEYKLLDHTVESQNIKILSTSSVLFKSFKSDIVFSVGDDLIAGLEAMSSFRLVDILRISLYMWQQIINYYLKNSKMLYGSRRNLKVPKVVCYILYTGDKDLKDQYSLRHEFFNDDLEAPDVIIKIIKPNNNIVGTVSNQYMRFCGYETEFLKRNESGYIFSKEEINNFLKRMINKGLLTEILVNYRKEIIEMISMFGTFQNYLDHKITESIAEGEAIGQKRGVAKGLKMGRKEIIESLLKNGQSIEEIAQETDMTPVEVSEILSNS